MEISQELRNQILIYQKNEITENLVYQHLADHVKDTENKKVLGKIARDELRHYEKWRQLTHVDVKPNSFRVLVLYLDQPVVRFYFWDQADGAGRG